MTMLLGTPASGKTTFLLALAGNLSNTLKVSMPAAFKSQIFHGVNIDGTYFCMRFSFRLKEKWHITGMPSTNSFQKRIMLTSVSMIVSIWEKWLLEKLSTLWLTAKALVQDMVFFEELMYTVFTLLMDLAYHYGFTYYRSTLVCLHCWITVDKISNESSVHYILTDLGFYRSSLYLSKTFTYIYDNY